MGAEQDTAISVLNCLHRSHFGGAQWRVVWVGENLVSEGVRTTALFPQNADTDYERFLSGRPFPFVRLKLPYLRAAGRVADNLRFLLDLPFQVARIARLIRRGRYDIVHVNGATNLGPVLAGLVTGRPVIWHWNDTMVPRPFALLAAQLLRLPNCWLIVASTAILARYPLRAFERRFLGVVPPPVVPSEAALPHREPAEDRVERVVGFVSNLVPTKGTREFVATIAALVAEGLPVRGVMMGGPLSGQEAHATELGALVRRLGIEGKIEMSGYRHDVADAMAGFDVLLFPSHSEAAPIVVLQALRQGVPLVVTDVGNVAEVVDGLGVPVVPVGDVKAMVAGVKQLLALATDERRAFRDAAQARIRSTFSLETIAVRHMQCYAFVLARRGKLRTADLRACEFGGSAE